MKETIAADNQGSLQRSAQGLVQLMTRRGGLLLLGILAAFALAFSDTLAELYRYWVEGYNWQFLIPIAFLFMLRERRDVLASLNYRPALFLGGLFLLASCALLVVGQISSTHTFREIALVATLFSMALLLFGVETVGKLFWPLVYLILMTSIPTDLLSHLREPLKMISATMSADALQALGYTVYREQNYLYLPHITLEVADSCSGLNQLTSGVALGIPIAFIMVNRLWKRIFLIALTIGLSIVMNWVRVFLISIWHYHSAKESIHGPYGIYELPFIFLVGIAIVLGVAFLIADKNDAEEQKNSAQGRFARYLDSPSFLKAGLLALVILATTAVYLYTWKPRLVPPVDPLDGFPVTLAGFQGQDVEKLERPFHSGLGTDELLRRYRGPKGQEALLYIGYFEAQNQQRELVDSRYNWLHGGAKTLSLALPSGTVKVKRVLVNTPRGPRLVYFTYKVNGRNLVDLKKAKLASLIDALTSNETNGGIVMVIFDAKKADELSPRQRQFLEAALPKALALMP